MTERYHVTGTNEIVCEHQDNNNQSIQDKLNESKLKVDKPNKEEDIYEYKCKKEASLNKHNDTKHMVHFCTHCNLKCLTMIDLLKHIPIEHVEQEIDSK